MLCRPLEERHGGWDICMSRRRGLKRDLLGYCSEPEQFGNNPILGKTQKYEPECQKRDISIWQRNETEKEDETLWGWNFIF